MNVAGVVRNRTRFAMVRFGNVLGSSGSVVPLFRRQIEAGWADNIDASGCHSVFHDDPRGGAIGACRRARWGRVGRSSYSIWASRYESLDLARRMVELSGHTVRTSGNPEGDIEVRIVGLRPGEKLYEELLIGDDPSPTAHPRIMKARENYRPWAGLRPALLSLERAAHDNDVAAVRNAAGATRQRVSAVGRDRRLDYRGRASLELVDN